MLLYSYRLLHVMFSLVVKLLLDISSSLLILLVLGHQVVHVGLSLGKLHLVHTLPGVPMEESLPPEHSGELLGDPLEDLLDSGGVTNEGGGHLESSGWDITNCGLHVVRDPFDEVAAVLVLDIQHLLIDLLHGHTTTEHGSN